MPTQSWDFTLEGKQHAVDIDVSFWTSAKTIFVDGVMLEKVAYERHGPVSMEYTFAVAHHKCTLTIVNDFIGHYQFRVGQALIKPMYPAILLEGWGWIFIIACLITPACTLGGFIPLVLGIVGAYYCAAVARNHADRWLTRAATCGGIVLFCWATTFTMYIVMGSAN